MKSNAVKKMILHPNTGKRMTRVFVSDKGWYSWNSVYHVYNHHNNYNQLQLSDLPKVEYDAEANRESGIVEQRVRVGEWNEALCFFAADHPRTEIAAQKSRGESGESWFVYFVTPKTALTIYGTQSQEDAESMARRIAPNILLNDNPYEMAKSYVVDASSNAAK